MGKIYVIRTRQYPYPLAMGTGFVTDMGMDIQPMDKGMGILQYTAVSFCNHTGKVKKYII